MNEFISSTLDNGILKIILDRPKKLNSVIEPMAEEIQKALANAKSNDEVRCILLTGKGKAFCAGQDLPEVVAIPPRTEVLQKILRIKKGHPRIDGNRSGDFFCPDP